MERQYLLDYINENECEFYRGCFNIIQTPCGSGKTFFCMDVICNPNTKYTLNRCLYVTDTRALADSVRLDYEKKTGMKASQWNWNLNVITYQTFTNIIHQKKKNSELNEWLKQYDYIFLDEVHQLFIYSRNFDKTKKGDNARYSIAIESLETICNRTTLICLSATPSPLYEHIFKCGLGDIVHDIVLPGDVCKIKSYVTHTTQRTIDLHEVVYNLKLDDNTKVFLYCQQVNQMKSYEKIFRDKGHSVLTLWSDNNTNHEMTDYQLQARDKLLTTGEFDEKILILNDAYESGINIEHSPDSKRQTTIVLVAHSDEIKREQARGRIRHDIDLLYYTVRDADIDYYEDCMGEENNVELCERLEQMVLECEEDEYRFINKTGQNEISDICNIHVKIKNRIIKIVKYDKLNNQLKILELPYRIECTECDRKINGVRVKRIYHVVRTKEK